MATAMKGAMGVALAMVIALTMVLMVMADGECSVAAPCTNRYHCCSKWGYCGTGEPYCGNGCQTGPCISPPGPTPPAPPTSPQLSDIFTRDLYKKFFPRHLPFYSYEHFIAASKRFPQFGTTGNTNTRKREIAAFAAHVTQETSGLQKIVEDNKFEYCDHRFPQFPCNGNRFYGRGPLQLTWNFNYGPCGHYLNLDLLRNPDLVATNPVISFESSLWFWNVGGDSAIPRMHDVITGKWVPSYADNAAGRYPGFGVTILILKGGLECNKHSDEANNRVWYFKEFSRELGISPGDHLDCRNMKPFYTIKLVTES